MRDFNFTIVSKISQKYVKPCIKCKKNEWLGDSVFWNVFIVRMDKGLCRTVQRYFCR